MTDRRVVHTHSTTELRRGRFTEIPWSRVGPVPTIAAESPVITPAQNLLVVGFSLTVTKITATGEVWAALIKNSDGAGGGDSVAGLRCWPGDNYAYVELNPPGQFIGRKDTYSIRVFQVGSTDAEDIGGTIELA